MKVSFRGSADNGSAAKPKVKPSDNNDNDTAAKRALELRTIWGNASDASSDALSSTSLNESNRRLDEKG